MVAYSRRVDWRATHNRLYEARQRRAAHDDVLDLTESNPTRVGLDYPVDELAQVLARHAGEPYEPHPLGLPAAREALATWLSTSSSKVSPDELMLTASTSEAYSFLFKLLANPGDEIVTAIPSYPLLDHLTALDSVQLRHFRLHFHRRWILDVGELNTAMTEATRAVVVVHPNNPTGSFLTVPEQDELASSCRERDLPVISDEVFLDYRWSARKDLAASFAGRADLLSFSLGGLSKSAGLPHWKLGWIRVGGPPAACREAVAGLELIADSYLSVSTPVQRALPAVLPLGAAIRDQIRERVQTNLRILGSIAGTDTPMEILEVEGGWSAVLRVPAVITDEDLAVELIESTGVLVHPGYFFDFPSEGYLVLSTLPHPELFSEGLRRLTGYLKRRLP